MAKSPNREVHFTTKSMYGHHPLNGIFGSVGDALRDLLDPRLRGGGGALAGGVGARAAERARKALQKLERSRCAG